MKPEYLEWDSDFFNCKVGRLEVGRAENISINLLSDFDLVYLIFKNEIPPEKKTDLDKIAFFADEKITYKKNIERTEKPGENIISWPAGREVSNDLLEIAVASGEFSRFRIDPMIPESKFTGLYQAWIINSVNRTIAEEVFYYNLDNQLAGVITLGIKNGKPDIGILSVHEKFRGKRIASQLITAAEYWAKEIKGFDTLQVVTQGSNLVACAFYEKCRFAIHKREYIYHWWKKNQKI